MLIRDSKTGQTFVNESAGEFGYKYETHESMWDLPTRMKAMDKLGVALEILSIGNPWLSYLPGEKAPEAARVLNTELASIVKNYPKKFAAMGVLPVTSSRVLEELDYAVNELGLRGFMVGTHVNGKPITSEEFLQIFERIAKLRVPIYVHPLARPDVFLYYDRATTASLVFPMETAIFAKEVVGKGLFDKFPNLKIVLAHLGGSVPFMLGRLDRAFSSDQRSPERIRESFRSFYLDSVSYFNSALEFASAIWGADKIMLGTDYPHIWGDDLERTVEVVTESKLSEEEKDLILSKNASRLFACS